jgi:hypothetical protein
MGWFADKYGKNTRPKMSIDLYDVLLTKFGEEATNDTLSDVQDGKVKESTLIKYLDKDSQEIIKNAQKKKK